MSYLRTGTVLFHYGLATSCFGHACFTLTSLVKATASPLRRRPSACPSCSSSPRRRETRRSLSSSTTTVYAGYNPNPNPKPTPNPSPVDL